jgi:DUF4097 and DUF4098 domain-containing protein YvlB
MTAMSATGFRISLAAALAVVAVSSAQAQGRTRIDTTFAFDRDGVVTLGNGSATIEVSGWDQPTVRIHARGDDASFRLDVTSKRVTLDPSRSNDDVTIQVQVPRGVRVVAHTNSGDITITGTRGDVDAQSSSGDLRITEAREVNATSLSGDVDIRNGTGSVTASTSNGDVTVKDNRGNVDASSVSGGVTVTRATAKTVRARTTSGDVVYTGSIEPNGTYDLSTHSGDVEVSIPKDASAQIAITTLNGDVESDFPITLKPGFSSPGNGTTKHYTLTVGGGSAHVTVESFNGDITISSRGK